MFFEPLERILLFLAEGMFLVLFAVLITEIFLSYINREGRVERRPEHTEEIPPSPRADDAMEGQGAEGGA